MEHTTELTYPEFSYAMAKINLIWYPILSFVYVAVFACIKAVNMGQKMFKRTENPLVESTGGVVVSMFLILLYGAIQWGASLPANVFLLVASLYAVQNKGFESELWIVLGSVISTIWLALSGLVLYAIAKATKTDVDLGYAEFATVQWVLNMVGSVPFTTLVIWDNLFV